MSSSSSAAAAGPAPNLAIAISYLINANTAPIHVAPINVNPIEAANVNPNKKYNKSEVLSITDFNKIAIPTAGNTAPTVKIALTYQISVVKFWNNCSTAPDP